MYVYELLFEIKLKNKQQYCWLDPEVYLRLKQPIFYYMLSIVASIRQQYMQVIAH